MLSRELLLLTPTSIQISNLRLSYFHSILASRYCIGLLAKSHGLNPRSGGSNKTKYGVLFLWRIPLSRFLAKIVISLKYLSFAVGFKLQVPALVYIIKIHNTSDWRAVITNYVWLSMVGRVSYLMPTVYYFLILVSFGEQNVKMSTSAPNPWEEENRFSTTIFIWDSR